MRSHWNRLGLPCPTDSAVEDDFPPSSPILSSLSWSRVRISVGEKLLS